MIALTIPDVLPSLNVQKRMHWAAYAKLRRQWAWLLVANGARNQGEPIPFAHITVSRNSPRLLDHDNLAGAFKPLIDVLRPVSKSNPNGLGLIEDDDASHVVVTYQQAKCPKAQQHTTIQIERGSA
jgi:hypothetical protein